MYSTAALMLANGHIGDLVAQADRERLADLVRHTNRSAAGPVSARSLRLGARARRLIQFLRALPRATAG